MRKKTPLVLLAGLALLVAGGVNIFKKIHWKVPTDGVTWNEKAGGLTAIKVDLDSPAYLAGIKKGDVLYSINNNLIKNKIELAKNLWVAGSSDQKVTYQINHQGDLIFPSFYLTKTGVSFSYFYLALIGLTALVIGYIVFFNATKPFALPYIFFFLVSITFYSFYIFSPTGQLDVLDSVFYWLDKMAFFLFPPLLLHFFIIFPKRKKLSKKRASSISFLYLPAAVLLLIKVFLHLSNVVNLSDQIVLRLYRTSEKLGLFHFSLFSLVAFGIIVRDSITTTNLIIKKQLKWIVYGLGFGIVPFSVLYVLPYLTGHVPSRSAELTIIFQALIPLTLAYSISRYRLMDLEVLLKKGVTLIFSYIVIAILYFIVSSRTQIFSENKMNAIILGILAIILGATLFSPLKKLIQSLLDRVIYKKSYHYRKTLLSISQELSRERNLQKLSQALLDLIANALSLESIALLLPLDDKAETFSILKSKDNLPSQDSSIKFSKNFCRDLLDKDAISVFPFKEKRESSPGFQDLSDSGFFHFLPLKVENKLIGCFGMGKKVDNTFLNSDDWELLKTISSPVALALENATLYSQANIRALELERLKDYSENIIESLTVGVAVLDQKGKIIGWNRVLEETFSKTSNDVLGKSLLDVLGEKNFTALFPSDTQQDFRLLSEITLGMPGGGDKIFDIAKTPLLDNNMNPYGTVIVFEDITEKISLQHQLLTSEKLASIGLLSAGVAHEINTPLTGISSYVQMLQKKLLKSEYSHTLKKIETQTERVARIVKNLLNFARNPSDSSYYNVDLKDSLQAIISLIEYKLKNMNIQLELHLSNVKPIWAQGERLQQVFINIILNAIDAMPRGGTLRIELLPKAKKAVIKIKDTGTGIKPQHLTHIFDPFFTTKGIGKGTGLGLSISYAIVREHEGTVGVESVVGKGSTFTISLPMDLNKQKITKTLGE